eukprot:XP_011662448.1 PREDICTED: FK506-binding protein 2-like [Strongylocentrotus purpuratus]
MPRYLYSTVVLTHAVWILVLLSLSAVLGIIDELRVEIEVDVTNCTERAEDGDTILLTYNGTFEDGVSFDATKPGASMNLTLGPSLIQGFNLGLYDACIGQTRRIFVPYRLGYGEAGAGGVIPPRTDIIFLVVVLDIFKPDYVGFNYENTTELIDIDDFDDETAIDHGKGKGDRDGKGRNNHVRRRPHRGRPFWWYVQFLAIPVLIILLIVDAYYLYKIYFPHGRVKFYKVRDHEPNDIVNTL